MPRSARVICCLTEIRPEPLSGSPWVGVHNGWVHTCEVSRHVHVQWVGVQGLFQGSEGVLLPPPHLNEILK